MTDHHDRGHNDDGDQRRRHGCGETGHDEDNGNRQREQRIDQPWHVKDVRHLCGEDQNAERIHKTDHHRTRNEAHHPRQPGKSEEDLDDAGKNDGRQDVADAMQLHHRPDHQRDRSRRRGDHRRPAAERRHHQAQHDRGDQRHLGIDAGDERERDHFRYQRQRGDHPGQRFTDEKVRRTKHRADRRRVFELELRGGGGACDLHWNFLKRFSSAARRLTHDAAEADMTGGGIDGLALTGRRPVAQAVVGSAQMRAALHREAYGFFVASARVAARLRLYRALLSPARQTGSTSIPRYCRPCRTGHSHWVERIDRRSTLITVVSRILVRKMALPGIGHEPPIRIGRIAPWVGLAFKATTGGEFPLGFARQCLAGPGRVSQRVLIGDMHDRMIVAAMDRTFRPLRMPPVGAGPVFPPGEVVAQIDRTVRLLEHQRARHQHFGVGIGIHRRIRRAFGIGDVSGRIDEFSEFGVGDRIGVDPETIDMQDGPGAPPDRNCWSPSESGRPGSRSWIPGRCV